MLEKKRTEKYKGEVLKQLLYMVILLNKVEKGGTVGREEVTLLLSAECLGTFCLQNVRE